MRDSIWKFSLRVTQAPQQIEVPTGAIIRHIGEQDGSICIWMEVTQSAPKEKRKFLVMGTGWELPEDRNYVGTVQMGSFVWHVYENRRAG